MNKMSEEINSIVADIVLKSKGLSDNKHMKICESLAKKYNLDIIDSIVSFDKVYYMALGLEYNEEVERKFLEMCF